MDDLKKYWEQKVADQVMKVWKSELSAFFKLFMFELLNCEA